MPYRFEVARSPADFEEVFRLANQVFAGELHQYAPDSAGRLVDKFHHKNRYILARRDEDVVGMIALHDQPPFSIAEKLADPSVLGQYGRLIEVRLLAVAPEHRNRTVMAGLMMKTYDCAQQHDTIIISGVVERSGIYRTLGFRELGPAVRSGDAWFVPMMIRVADLAARRNRWKQRLPY